MSDGLKWTAPHRLDCSPNIERIDDIDSLLKLKLLEIQKANYTYCMSDNSYGWYAYIVSKSSKVAS